MDQWTLNNQHIPGIILFHTRRGSLFRALRAQLFCSESEEHVCVCGDKISSFLTTSGCFCWIPKLCFFFLLLHAAGKTLKMGQGQKKESYCLIPKSQIPCNTFVKPDSKMN